MNSVLNGQLLQYCHNENIYHHPERISLLQHYEDQYYWNGLEFQLTIQKIGKFEKNNSGIAVIVLFNCKNDVHTVHR